MSKLFSDKDGVSEGFSTGREIGERLPDQFGKDVHFSAARGSNRALILFFRSASC